MKKITAILLVALLLMMSACSAGNRQAGETETSNTTAGKAEGIGSDSPDSTASAGTKGFSGNIPPLPGTVANKIDGPSPFTDDETEELIKLLYNSALAAAAENGMDTQFSQEAVEYLEKEYGGHRTCAADGQHCIVMFEFGQGMHHSQYYIFTTHDSGLTWTASDDYSSSCNQITGMNYPYVYSVCFICSLVVGAGVSYDGGENFSFVDICDYLPGEYRNTDSVTDIENFEIDKDSGNISFDISCYAGPDETETYTVVLDKQRQSLFPAKCPEMTLNDY